MSSGSSARERLQVERRVAHSVMNNIAGGGFRPVSDLRRQVRDTRRLPPMPEIAPRILRLANDPNADAADLAEVVQLDPALAAQVVHWANSPLYVVGNNVTGVRDAIVRVGFDLVMSLAFGLAAMRPFRVPKEGPVGLHAIWRSSLYSASLCHRLVRRLHPELRPELPTAYLSGLLHNLGLLLLGHLFPDEHRLVGRLMEANPQVPLINVESYICGVDHVQMGLWLMEAWQMPEPVQVALREQDDEDYEGEHAACAGLVLLSDRLLRRVHIGFGEHGQLSEPVLERLGLDEEACEEALDQVVEQGREIDALTRQLLRGA